MMPFDEVSSLVLQEYNRMVSNPITDRICLEFFKFDQFSLYLDNIYATFKVFDRYGRIAVLYGSTCNLGAVQCKYPIGGILLQSRKMDDVLCRVREDSHAFYACFVQSCCT